MLPILYTAWADRVLSPLEIKLLRQAAANASFLSKEDRSHLLQWGQPDRPPSPLLFRYWEIELQRAAAELPANTPKTLSHLGLQMGTRAGATTWDTTEVLRQLQEMESALGQISLDTHHQLFGTSPPKAKAGLPARNELARQLAQLLDQPFPDLRERMRSLLSGPGFELQHFEGKEDYRKQVLEWLLHLAQQGFGALAYPFAQGGQQDMGAYATVFEMLGYHDLSLAVKFGVQFGLFGGSIHQLGTKRHHERYLEAIGKGELLGCFAMTETGHGSNVRGLETTITFDPSTDEFVVHSPRESSGKEYIGNALHAQLATVFGQLITHGENHGVHAVLVPIRDMEGNVLPGVRVVDSGHKMGLNGVDNGRIWLDTVRVPRENLLDRFGQVDAQGRYHSPIQNSSRRFFTMLGTLVGGRVCVPRAGLSAAKAGLATAIRYGLSRRQFSSRPNKPETLLLDYPSHQRRLMPLLAKAYALHFSLQQLSQDYVGHDGEDMREIETQAAALKAYATWFTTACLQECREACGGKGYLSENRIDRLKADTDIFTTFEGDNTVLMQLVAKGLLTKFQKAFNEDGNRALLRYLGGRFTTAVSELNPFTVRNTSQQHLLSEEFHLAAFRFRETKLLHNLGERMRGHIKNGKSAYEAGLIVQPHMIALGEAYAERLTLERFVEAARQCPEGAPRQALRKACQLYALHTIEAHKGWYLEADYLAGNKTKAIRREVDELCRQLRALSAPLTDAFGIPDAFVGIKP